MLAAFLTLFGFRCWKLFYKDPVWVTEAHSSLAFCKGSLFCLQLSEKSIISTAHLDKLIYIRWALLDVFVSILSTIPTYDCAPGSILLCPEFVVSCDAHAGQQISTSFRLMTFSQPSGKPQEEQFFLFSLVITEVIVSGWQPCCRFDKRHRQQCNETWRKSRNVWHKCLELKQYQSQSASHVCPCFSLCGDLCVCYTAATSPRDKSQDGSSDAMLRRKEECTVEMISLSLAGQGVFG